MALEITLITAATDTLPRGSCLIVPVFEGFKKETLPANVSRYAEVLINEEFEAKKDQTATYHDGERRVTFVGMGKTDEFSFGGLQVTLGDNFRREITKHKETYIDGRAFLASLPRIEVVLELVEIINLSTYAFKKYKSEKATTIKEDPKVYLILDQVTDEDQKYKLESDTVSESVKMTRDLCNEPPNIAHPEFLAKYIESASKDVGCSVEVFDEKKIQSMGMNLVWAVGKGSPNLPRFVKISYFGDSSTKEFIALVGKGVAYDTGGVQVKPDFSMNNMKSDMAGAAAMFGVVHALAKLKRQVNVVAYLPLVQNMVDGASYLPDDIYTAFNGKTVEIIHTDAEGRLILADALAFASSENPSEIIDMATLTGAASIALGDRYAAVMGTNDSGIKKMQEIGYTVDEHVWQLPLPVEYKEYLKSEIADLANLPKTRSTPGTIIAAMFLKEFVDEKIPWIHMDVAAVMRQEKDKGTKTGKMVGFGVQLLVRYLSKKK